MTFKVGYAQQPITPVLDRPVYLAGFGQNRRAETVHDELYVRALALELGGTRLVAAALDLIGLPRQHCQEIERRIGAQAPGTRLLLACTHTHHGPDTIGFWGPDLATSGVDPLYLSTLKDRVTATALAALAQTQPAYLRSTSVQVTGVAKNARNPEILDEELTCLQFCRAGTSAVLQSTASEVLATWLLFPCHAEVLWEHNPHITSDYPASLRQAVETETGAPCLFMAGDIGGMMTPDVREHSFAEAEAMGQTLARAALVALAGVPATPVDRLVHSRHKYTVPMTNPLFHMALGAGLLPTTVNDDGTITTEVHLLKLGPAWLLGVPGELLPALGLAFKAEMRQAGADPAAVMGLTNDELGYILPEEDFFYPEDPFEPGSHYEETMSVGPEAAPRLQAAMRALLSRGG